MLRTQPRNPALPYCLSAYLFKDLNTFEDYAHVSLYLPLGTRTFPNTRLTSLYIIFRALNISEDSHCVFVNTFGDSETSRTHTVSPFASAFRNSDILEVLPRATLHLPSETRTFSRTHIVSLYLHSGTRKLRGPTPCFFACTFRDWDILEDLPRATLHLPSELGLFPDLSSCLNTYCSRQSSPYVERPSIRENEAERDVKTEI